MTKASGTFRGKAIPMAGCPELEATFRMKHGDPRTTGWAPRQRFRIGYFTPDDVYEATVSGHVQEGSDWIDIGCGRHLFPTNPALARQLADRCGTLVGIDPDATLEENPFVHRRERCTIDAYKVDRVYDLVTLRMVAEHITDPRAAIRSLARLTRPGGRVIVFTVNRHSPVPVASGIVPFGLHHAIKRVLWSTEERDTFPVAYRMNTRRELRQLFEEGGFSEVDFAYLDDCRTLARFRPLHWAELTGWRLFKAVGLRYPENCLLGVYERVGVGPIGDDE